MPQKIKEHHKPSAGNTSIWKDWRIHRP